MASSTDEIANPEPLAQRSALEQFARTASRSNCARKRKRGLTIALFLAAALALGFGFWSLSRRLIPEITAPASAESAYMASFPEKSIAVLPFEDLSEAKQDVYLADGVQDDILTALSKVADLRVISRTSVRTYAPGKPRNLREIAQSLGAAYILQGSVRASGDKVRITAQLTDARRDARLWSDSYERDVTDVFAVHSDIVQQIASQLQAVVSPQEKTAIDERPTRDLVAYGLYVRGKELVASVSFNAQINEKLVQAAQLLDQAISRDPKFLSRLLPIGRGAQLPLFFWS